MTTTPDTTPENVARRVEALRRASGRFDILDCETALQVADLAEALAARVASRDETLDRMLAQVTALTADAEAARHAAARNFDRAETAEAMLLAEAQASLDRLARAETAEAKLAASEAREERLREALEPFASIGIGADPDYRPLIRLDRNAILRARAALEGDKP